MKVLNRTDFLAMPAGTIYAKGVQWAFDSLEVKGDTLGSDWVCLDPCWVSGEHCPDAFMALEDALATGDSVPGDDDWGRDGCFDEDAVFLVFERPDLERLRGYIDAAIELTPPRTGDPIAQEEGK